MTRVVTNADRCTSTAHAGCINRKFLIGSLLCMSVFNLLLFFIFWCTNLLQNTILSTLVMSEDSMMYGWWLTPPVGAVYKIRIFNYTNVEAFESGTDEKLKVQELGPYVYQETLTRVNPKFYSNGTMSFQESRTFTWTGGSPENETVVAPNVPLLAALAMAKDMSFFAQLGVTGVMSALQPKTFVTVPAGGFLWGYDDQLFDAARPVLSLVENIPVKKFGMLALKNGPSQDVIMMNTGTNDLSKLGMIERINGQNNRGVWGDKKCDEVYGANGYFFPPGMYEEPNSTISYYAADMCRTLKLNQTGHGSVFGIPSISFKFPNDVFSFSKTNGYCFCQKVGEEPAKSCPPRGIFNVKACSYNLPVMVSLPHFLHGDNILYSNVDGLHPSAELHETRLEIHPRLGLLMGGHSKLQMNVQAGKAAAVPFLGNIKDGQILPLLWIEITLGEVPDSFLSILHHAYFTVEIMEISCKWGSIFGIIFSNVALFYLFRKRRIEHGILKRNVSGQDKLLEESS